MIQKLLAALLFKTLSTPLLIIALLSPIASADIKKLLDSRDRPTIADIKRELKGKEALQNSFSGPTSIDVLKEEVEQAAIIIAELEWAYPGAIYLPLGRDCVWLGDIVDAFYQAHGQTGRVKRLNASGQSLWVREELIARWIQSSGVDIKNLSKGPSYIIFDSSKYSLPAISQSTKILSAVYNSYTRQGGQAKDIITKFAFFNLNWAAKTSVRADASVDRDQFFIAQYDYLTANPGQIPNRTFAPTRRSLIYSEWHEEFGLLTEMPDGSVLGPPPDVPAPLARRTDTLTIMRKIMELVAEPEFLEKVSARAKELGYEFKIKANCDVALEQEALSNP